MTALNKRIHITGASGSGVSTTGKHLAARLEVPCFDTDDVYWIPTDPPYRVKRDIPDRLRLLDTILSDRAGWVLAGSLGNWGDALVSRFDLVVFLHVPTPIRLQRLKARERSRFGDRLDPGGVMHEQHQAFLTWAAGYDAPGDQGGRSLQAHLDWLARLTCPVVRIEGDHALDDVVCAIAARVNS